jgi:hypothetical protein
MYLCVSAISPYEIGMASLRRIRKRGGKRIPPLSSAPMGTGMEMWDGDGTVRDMMEGEERRSKYVNISPNTMYSHRI